MTTTRLNLSFEGEEVRKLLEKLAKLGKHSTITDTISKSLRVYEFLLEEKNNESQIIIRDRNGKETVIVFL